jgi:hypothetical protein
LGSILIVAAIFYTAMFFLIRVLKKEIKESAESLYGDVPLDPFGPPRPSGAALGGGGQYPPPAYNNRNSNNGAAGAKSPEKSFKAFSGKGYRLGDAA